MKVAHRIALNEDDPTVTLTSASPTSLDQLLGQRETKPSFGDRAAESDAIRKLHSKEYEIAATLQLTELERVAVIGQGGFGRVELVSNSFYQIRVSIFFRKSGLIRGLL